MKTLAEIAEALAWVVYGAAFMAVMWLFDHLPVGAAQVLSLLIIGAAWLAGRALRWLSNLLISLTRV